MKKLLLLLATLIILSSFISANDNEINWDITRIADGRSDSRPEIYEE